MAKKKQESAGGAVVAAKPIDEAKVLGLIVKMAPEVKGVDTLQNAVVNLLTEYDRTKRKLAEKPTSSGDNLGEVLAGIKRIESSLQQTKEQLSIMRQYGVGAVAQK